jgi:hypothetical protein
MARGQHASFKRPPLLDGQTRWMPARTALKKRRSMVARKEDFPTVSDRRSTGLNEGLGGRSIPDSSPTLKGGGMWVYPLLRPTPTHPPDRVCAEEGCDTRLPSTTRGSAAGNTSRGIGSGPAKPPDEGQAALRPTGCVPAGCRSASAIPFRAEVTLSGCRRPKGCLLPVRCNLDSCREVGEWKGL